MSVRFSFFIVCFLFSILTWGRSPAIEPVQGFSIEEYKPADPKKERGFDWDQKAKIEKQAPSKYQMAIGEAENHPRWPSYLFIIAVLSLPLFLWYSLLKHIDEEEDKIVAPPQNSYSEETISLAKHREKLKKDEDDDLPKAS